jgi:hypothetical protein
MRRRLTNWVLAQLSKSIVCRFRNGGGLETLHSGKCPRSATGDYSDVKVVTPFGEIPWNELSRFDDEEMKHLMVGLVDTIFTALNEVMNRDELYLKYLAEYEIQPKWDEPMIDRQAQVWYDVQAGRKTLDQGIDESTRLKEKHPPLRLPSVIRKEEIQANRPDTVSVAGT